MSDDSARSLTGHTKFRVFLSYPSSGREMARKALEICRREITHGIWRNDFVLEACMWDKDERPVQLDAFLKPNQVIFARNFPPREADLFVVFLTNRIGAGTIAEIADRLAHASSGGSSQIQIYLKDEPPKKSDGEISQAQADYDAMFEWLRSPYQNEGGHRKPLAANVNYIKVEDDASFLDRFRRELQESLMEKYKKRSAPVPASSFKPYPGLRHLSEEHANCIFGRDMEIEFIESKQREGKRFFMIFGVSGVGKSSLVYAGVLGRAEPKIKKLALIPHRQPSSQLAELLEGLLPDTTKLLIKHDPDSALEKLDEALSDYERLILFFDQFERIYSADAGEIAAFTRILMALRSSSKCTVILTQRADQMHEWSSRPDLSNPEIWEMLPVDHVRRGYLRDVIVGPARMANLPPPESALVFRLIEDFEDRRHSTPLLALILHDLYELSGRGASAMSLAGYESIGGLEGIVDRRTKRLLDNLRKYGYGEQQMNEVFSLVVDVNEDGQPVSKRAPRARIEAIFSPEVVEDELIKPFFLRTEEAETGGEGGALTLAHDIYFDEWPLLTAWVDGNRSSLREIRDVEREAVRWETNGQSPAYLLPAERVEAVAEAVERSGHRLRPSYRNVVERFVSSSVVKSKQRRLKEAILRGEMGETDDLLREGVRAEEPLPGDPFSAFYNAIWGEEEGAVTRRLGAMDGQESAINNKSARYRFAKGFTPLHFAALAGRTDKIKLIVVGLGIDVNETTYGGSTPLACAAYGGKTEAVALLLQLGADPEIRNLEFDLRPVDWAVQRGHSAVADLLLTQAGDFSRHIPPDLARGLIVSAASGGHADQIRRYLALTDGESLGPIVQEALLFALRLADPECIRALLAAGARAEWLDPRLKGSTTLHQLAGRGKRDALAVVVEAIESAGIDTPDARGMTPLHVVIYFADEDVPSCVDLLLANGADPALTDNDGDTALHLAAIKGHKEVVARLIGDRRVVIEAQNAKGGVALGHAALAGHDEIVRLLLRAGAKTHTTDEEGNTPLHLAVATGKESIVRLLLEDDQVKVRSPSKKGHTPLMVASRGGNYPIVAMLLERSDDQGVNAVDRWGWTAMNHAAHAGHEPVVQQLLEAGARLPLWSARIPSPEEGGGVELRRLRREELGAAIAEGLAASGDGEWSVPPLIGHPEQWSVAESSQASDLLHDLADSLSRGPYWLNVGPVSRVRTLALRCYPNTLLCEAETQVFDGAEGLLAFIHTGASCTLLDGTSQPLHKLNQEGAIDLAQPESVLQYLCLFCAAVQGEEGPFTIISGLQDLDLLEELDAKSAYWAPAWAMPPTAPELNEAEKVWRISATVLYSRAIFGAEFGVRPEGLIEMLSDTPKASELPIRRWGFWGNVRREITALSS